MIPGFNHNIKHKGRVFHIQTEDSGAKNPHIITHLFVGGNILASKKTEYSEILGKPEYEKTVRSMMEEQHKQMLRNLVNGVYDAVQTGQAYHLDGPAPMNFTANSPATSAMAGGAAFKGLPSQIAAAAPAASPPAASPPAFAPQAFPPPTFPPPTSQPLPVPVPLDFQRPQGGIPVSGTPHTGTEPPPPEVIAAQQEAAAAQAAARAQADKPVEKPRPAPGSLFGENLISEKSLDEVILGYLAEDLADLE